VQELLDLYAELGAVGGPMRLLFVTWDGPGTVYHETLFIPC
jgi:hypothetical protein